MGEGDQAPPPPDDAPAWAVRRPVAVQLDGRDADSFTREERRDLVDERLRFHRRRSGGRRGTVEVRLRSPEGQLLRYDRDEATAAFTENGVTVTADETDTDVATAGSGCRVEGFDADVDGGSDRIDLGTCGVVEVTR